MYENGNKKPLEDVWRAWKGIKELELEDLNSFFNLAGYHGEPFVGAGAYSNKYWGGYCNHGNVLFPTWHRVYVLMVERALQSVVPDVMLPYWDETSPESLSEGIPWALTKKQVELDGVMIQNPLISFKFPVEVDDAANNLTSVFSYTKQKGYTTVRYPLSGLVGTEEARAETKAHNAKYPNYEQNVAYLNDNVTAWLNSGKTSPKAENAAQALPKVDSIHRKYLDCLNVPEYTAFSNTTSAAHWNKDKRRNVNVTALEDPHNDVHLSVGGFYKPGDPNNEFGEIAGANADMGENNTASFDPIFFFHHCNVDRMFWLWQQQNGRTDDFGIEEGDPGAKSTNPQQGPTPNFLADSELSMDTPLTPFMISPLKDQRMYTSRDVINIEKQMGVTYSKGSLEKEEALPLTQMVASAKKSRKTLLVSGINRELFTGSFLVVAYAEIDGEKRHVGTHSVLSRWSVKQCANCLNHLEVEASFSLEELSDEEIERATFSVDFVHRGGGHAHLVGYKLEVVE